MTISENSTENRSHLRPTKNECLNYCKDNGLNQILLKEQAKEPIGAWRRYQTEITTDLMFERLKRSNINYGVVCGSISDNLVVLDIDLKKLFDPFKEIYREIIGIELLDDTFVVESSNGKIHAYFRISDNVIIETHNSESIYGFSERGEGSYVVG
ncbi:unnamed protein product, partial [marine sediment metagenome]